MSRTVLFPFKTALPCIRYTGGATFAPGAVHPGPDR